jgi:hypothetical protein
MNKLFLFTFISALITLVIRIALLWDMEVEMHGLTEITMHIMYVFGPFAFMLITYIVCKEIEERL